MKRFGVAWIAACLLAVMLYPTAPAEASTSARDDLVAVREQASLQVARQLGLQHAVLIPDAAFLTHPTNPGLEAEPCEDRQRFTVTGS